MNNRQTDPTAGNGAVPPNPEVVEKPKRRRFTADYKRRILDEADACKEPGALGAMLRREGLYSSHLSSWRRQRNHGLKPRKRGRKGKTPEQKRVAELEKENARLQREKAINKSRQDAVLKVLEARFRIVPEPMTDAVHAIHDEAKLDDLIRKAATAATLDEFQAELPSAE